ncbi:AAA family ATPase [Bradyrhizobium sp. HKCCYLS1011]|uniref:AAA family ATPase n=1 Tax=Bradyrhizobium sp. HKCCYLS1011 TaxID=3420733 RepID=UPI003EBBD680
MICMHCRASVEENKKFCGDCGAPLPWRCHVCSSENAPDKRFCGECGTSSLRVPSDLPVAALPETGLERRHLTVMFVDLVGSTVLGRQLDPEDLRHVIAGFNGAVITAIKQYEGFVARYLGDGILAYFGYPQAHEADAERAISAGLAAVSAVGGLASKAGPPGTLSARVGIATGLVVVGDLLGASQEAAAIGDTPNLAARLQSAARPGTVCISEATKRLAGGLFEYQQFDTGIMKGRPPGEPAWLVLGQSSVDSRFEALHPRQLRLVNRIEEVELLQRRWQQVNSGEGRVVLLCGDPGIGKSRLVATIEQVVRDGRHFAFRFSCSPLHRHTPLYPVIHLVQRIASLHGTDSADVRREKLRRSLPADASAEDIVHLADLLSIPNTAEEQASNVSPRAKKEMTFTAILRQFESSAWRSPIAVTFEDIHWADATTLDLLARLIDLAEQIPILVIITSRRVDPHPAWSSRPHVTVRILNALDRHLAAVLVQEVAGNLHLSSQFVDRIVANSDGVPLFIEELTRSILERDRQQNDGSNDSTEWQFAPGTIPATLHASLMSRLDRLPLGKEIAQTSSVIGREFSFDILQAISDLSHIQIKRSLRELIEAQLIIPHDAVYLFKHALVQETAYASLPRERRSAIHRKIAEVLEKAPADVEATLPQVTAWHFAEAGMPDKAVTYYLRSADLATGRFALAEMVNHLRNALRQLELLPDSPERRRRELPIQVALGRALIDHEGSGSEEVRTTFERALRLCLEFDDTHQMIRVHDGLINYYFTHSAYDKMLSSAHELRDAGHKAGNRQALLVAKRSSGFAHLLSGSFAKAHDDLRSFLDMYEASRDGPEAALTTRDPKVSACTILGICLTAMGNPDSGAAMSTEGIKHAETLNHQVSLVLGLRRACVQRIMQRDDQGVRDLAARIFKITSEYETFKGARDGMIFHCWGQFRATRDPFFLNEMQVTIRHFETTEHWAFLPFFMASAAELRGEIGDRAGAMDLLDRATKLVESIGEKWCAAEIIRLRGLYGARNNEEKRALLQASLVMATDQGAKLWQLRAAINLAELLQSEGDEAGAHALLAPISDSFTEGADTSDLISARTLLARLGERSLHH